MWPSVPELPRRQADFGERGRTRLSAMMARANLRKSSVCAHLLAATWTERGRQDYSAASYFVSLAKVLAPLGLRAVVDAWNIHRGVTLR